MELLQYIYDKLKVQYPDKVVVGLREASIDDRILLYEVNLNNKETKENQRVGDVGVCQITRHGHVLADLYLLYDWCVTNLIPDKVNIQSCVVTERVVTSFNNGLYRMDIRVNISK
jgi:hypothetical protein